MYEHDIVELEDFDFNHYIHHFGENEGNSYGEPMEATENNIEFLDSLEDVRDCSEFCVSNQ